MTGEKMLSIQVANLNLFIGQFVHPVILKSLCSLDFKTAFDYIQKKSYLNTKIGRK